MLIFCEFGESGNKSHESVGTFIQMEKNKNILKNSCNNGDFSVKYIRKGMSKLSRKTVSQRK